MAHFLKNEFKEDEITDLVFNFKHMIQKKFRSRLH